MFYDPEYVDIFEDMTLENHDEKENQRARTQGISVDTEPQMSLKEAIARFCAVVTTEPGSPSSRTGDYSAAIDPTSPVTAAADGRPTDPAPGTDAGLEDPLEAMSLDGLRQRAQRIFGGGARSSLTPSTSVGISEVSLKLIVDVKSAVNKFFSEHAGNVCISPEKDDCQLSQEEAYGYLVGSLIVGEMLAHEARPVGKRLDYYATEEKKVAAAAKESARQKKKSLRKKKSLSVEELTAQSEAIDRAAEEALAARLDRVIDLKLPDFNTRVVERRAPPKDAPRVDYTGAGDTSKPFWAAARHPEIKGYRGRPGGGGGDPDERYWNPRKPPCVPSDDRPEHLFNTRVAAEAASAASMVEAWEPPPYEDEYYCDEERYALACVKHEHAIRRLREAFADVDPCPLARASRHATRPCPCGRGVLARWPWVVQTAQLGFCACDMASWELTCWRSDWLSVVGRDLPL